jgi:PleD family two-component response regulator
MRDGFLAATAGLRIPVRSDDAIRTRTYWRNMRSLMQRTAPLILIVNHDAATLAVYDELLRSAGYATLGCQMASEAQRHIHANRPDLLGVSTVTEQKVALRKFITSRW